MLFHKYEGDMDESDSGVSVMAKIGLRVIV